MQLIKMHVWLFMWCQRTNY